MKVEEPHWLEIDRSDDFASLDKIIKAYIKTNGDP
jgi:hypothetical protein